MTMIIHEQRETTLSGAERNGDALWTALADVERATGWALKPEGLCRGEVCVPLRPQQRAALVRGVGSEAKVELSGLWRALGGPVVSDAAGTAWVLGTGANERVETLQSLEAPDFALPDLAGRIHRLSEHRGKKVLLVTFASW